MATDEPAGDVRALREHLTDIARYLQSLDKPNMARFVIQARAALASLDAEPVDVQRVYQRGVEAGKALVDPTERASEVPRAPAQRWGSDALDVFYGAAADLRDGWPKLYAKALDVVTARSNVNLKDSAAGGGEQDSFEPYFKPDGSSVIDEVVAAAPLQREPVYGVHLIRSADLPAAGAQREPLSDERIDSLAQDTVYENLDEIGISQIIAARKFARRVLAASPVDPRPLNMGLGDPIEAKASAVQRPAGGDDA